MQLKLLKKENYLARIKNAARGENYMFRNLYATVDDEKQDILQDGALSCAVFVSSLIYLQNPQGTKLIDFVHSSVPGTEKDLLNSGWQLVNDLKEGAVIVWETVKGRFAPGMGDVHSHIGFYVGDDKAVSNDYDGRGIPGEHHYTFGNNEDGTPKRKVERIYWHAGLDAE